METKNCKNCGAPLEGNSNLYGTNADGSKNEDYCSCCFENGKFTGIKYCQSCGMPLEENSNFYGTNADGSKNKDYCSYCFENGKFTASNITMEDMIEMCAPHMVKNIEGFTEDKAKKMMREFFPMLKRWKK